MTTPSFTPGRYALRNILDATIFDFKTSNLLFRIDYGTAAQNDWKANQTVVRGGAGAPTRVVFNDSKDSTLKISTEIFSMAQLAMLAGATVSSGVKNILKHEVLTVQSNGASTPLLQVTTEKTPVSVTGAVTVQPSDIYVVVYQNGVQGAPITVSSVSGSTITLTGVTAGQEVEVYYQWATDASAQTITFDAKNFPQYVKIVGNSLFADEVAGDMVAGQVTYFKAKAQPNFSLNFNATGNATQLDMMFDILPTDSNGKSPMSELVLYEDPDVA